ncbi:hypothetical protein GGR57DRAFT_451540, partial [Xylariaceae sp. FL1272]
MVTICILDFLTWCPMALCKRYLNQEFRRVIREMVADPEDNSSKYTFAALRRPKYIPEIVWRKEYIHMEGIYKYM